MDEFFHRERLAMSQNDSPKIEPTLTSIESAPSIAPTAGEAAEPVKDEIIVAPAPKADEIAPKAGEPGLPPAPKLEAVTESAKAAESKAEPRFDAKVTRMPVLHKAEPASGPEVVVKPRVGRFALLAACVAIAASFGAVGGSLGVAKFGPMFASAPAHPAPVAKDNVAEEVKSLKETVAQLRSTTKSLSDNLAALKTSVNTSNTAQNAQIGKIAETLDRVEKTQGEQKKTAQAPAPHTTSTTQAVAAASSDITGSIGQQKTPVPMVLGEPPQNLKAPVVQGWVLRRVYDGAALIEGREGIVEVEPGMILPGLGRIDGIKRQDGRWVVLTARGVVVGR
jgi:hypothetical protein